MHPIPYSAPFRLESNPIPFLSSSFPINCVAFPSILLISADPHHCLLLPCSARSLWSSSCLSFSINSSLAMFSKCLTSYVVCISFDLNLHSPSLTIFRDCDLCIENIEILNGNLTAML